MKVVFRFGEAEEVRKEEGGVSVSMVYILGCRRMGLRFALMCLCLLDFSISSVLMTETVRPCLKK